MGHRHHLNIIHLACSKTMMIAFIIRQASNMLKLTTATVSRGTEYAHMFYSELIDRHGRAHVAHQEPSPMTDSNLPEQSQNPVKDPADWATGDQPMTGPQASYLKTLQQQAGMTEEDFDPSLTKAQASQMIDELQQKTGRGTSSN
jgi:hypothetical protein